MYRREKFKQTYSSLSRANFPVRGVQGRVAHVSSMSSCRGGGGRIRLWGMGSVRRGETSFDRCHASVSYLYLSKMYLFTFKPYLYLQGEFVDHVVCMRLLPFLELLTQPRISSLPC